MINMQNFIGRRRFLQMTTALGVSSVLPFEAKPASSAATAMARKFTMDLVPGMIGVQAPFPELIDLAQKQGFESIAPDAGYLGKLSDDQLQELLNNMETKGLAFGSAGLPVDFRKEDEVFLEGLKRLPDFAKVLERAGAKRVNTYIMPNHPELTYLANFQRHADRLREIAKVLGDHDIRFGLEYVGTKTLWTAQRHPFLHTMAETKELIAEIDQPNVGFVLDSWHWYTAGETEADLLTLTNSDVVACDLNDAPAGLPVDEQIDNRRALPMATGVIDLKSFLNTLVKIGYDGPVRAEPFSAELRELPDERALAETAKALKAAFALVD